ncbi:MAG: polysaccharide deacetylase family protein [Hyphomicrobiaceae bacterium]|nr:polysaccharide deacetylase family protein [Hyphomicrobiaceae bacterium]
MLTLKPIVTRLAAAAAIMLAAGSAHAADSGAATSASIGAAKATSCDAKDGGLGVDRIVEIDTSTGPLYGALSRYEREKSFLAPKEVVLTFDDGPMPWITRSILDTLDRFCTKATFFSVGRMAVAYPQMVRDVLARGHTLGGHTWSHPLNLKRLKGDKAIDQIERGFAALALTSGGRVSPFFRFPGLSDNPTMLEALQKRGIATFTVDVVSDDSFIASPSRLAKVTVDRVVARNGGIVLFHDIKAATAKALPVILTELRQRGFKVVHMRSEAMLKPLPELVAELQPLIAKKDPPRGGDVKRAAMLPFYGAVGPERLPPQGGLAAQGPATTEDRITVEVLRPEARDRLAPRKKSGSSGAAAVTANAGDLATPPPTRRERKAAKSWSTKVSRERLNRTLVD